MFLQQARTAALAATQESDLREQTPLGSGGGPPPFPMDAARGAGSGCAGGSPDLATSPKCHRISLVILAGAPAVGLCRGADRGEGAGGLGRGSPGMRSRERCGDGRTSRRVPPAGRAGPGTPEHPSDPRPAVTRGSPAGWPRGGGGGGSPRTSLSILYAPAVSQRGEETQIASERRLSQGLSRPCPLVPSAGRQKSPRAIPCVSLQPQQLPALQSVLHTPCWGQGRCECDWQQLQ